MFWGDANLNFLGTFKEFRWFPAIQHSMKKLVLKVHPDDNVIVALADLPRGSTVTHEGMTCTLADAIPAKHKFFTTSLNAGEAVIMYGVMVGKTQAPVVQGGLMTTTNVRHAAGAYAWRDAGYAWSAPDVDRFRQRSFLGYHRADGKVGTANYWLFIPTVFCENRNLDVIKEALHHELGYAVTGRYRHFARQLREGHALGQSLDEILFTTDSNAQPKRYFEHVDGIKFLNHAGGCGGTRQDAATLGRLLASYACHPNVGGITVLSLGCQHLQVQDFLAELKQRDPSFAKPLYIFEQQQSQSEPALIAEAIRASFAGIAEINRLERRPAPLSQLCIGVKCGGSDGFSGISANPAVGYCADLLVALGGKVLLSEFPELCGIEQELIDRCTARDQAEKFIALMQQYSAEAEAVGSGFHMNPSPGNIRDGLITDAMKSAGAAKKAGTSPVEYVLDYTEPATRSGLGLVCTPGNDVESTTGLASSGATLILFTTGLGTPTGNPVCPTIKVATNSALARRMADIIDIDTGPIIDGEQSIEEMGAEILEYCIRAASGEVIPKAVQLNQDDFIPWKRGVSL
jgi:altronate hydrolase